MNATIVVAASSILLACVAFAFFMLQGGSDELTGSKSGSMTFTGEGHEYGIKYQVGDDEMSVTIFIEDETHSALWVKTAKDGEYESEEIFLNDAATYEVVEFENGVATSCRMNTGRDQEAINKMIASISYDGGSDTYSITEDDFDGTPVTISVTATVGDVTMPDFDWSTCESIGDPVDPFRDGDSRRVLEAMVETERALGYTTAGNLAQEVYDAPSDNSRVKCVPSTSWVGGFGGEACYIKDNCLFSFRGSDDNADWADNILGAAGIESKNGAWIHAGFYNQLQALVSQTNINSEVNGCGNPTFIGHSLGGALANVAHTYWNKGSINTYAGASPYMGRRTVSCTESYRHCWWRKWWHYKCENRSRQSTCNTWHHTSGKRTYHENDPVPYAANIAGYNHGGGVGYRIEWTTDRAWWCYFDWCGSNGRWESKHKGETNEPTAGFYSTLCDIAQNAWSIGVAGGTHYHSMSVHYQPYAV
jgi:hypothetical protein